MTLATNEVSEGNATYTNTITTVAFRIPKATASCISNKQHNLCCCMNPENTNTPKQACQS